MYPEMDEPMLFKNEGKKTHKHVFVCFFLTIWNKNISISTQEEVSVPGIRSVWPAPLLVPTAEGREEEEAVVVEEHHQWEEEE